MKDFERNNYMDIKQVTGVTDLTHSRIYGLRRAGKFPAGLKIGSARLWTAESVNDWLKSRKDVKNEYKFSNNKRKYLC